MPTTLAAKKCVPCEGGASPLSRARIAVCAKELNCAWKIIGKDKLSRSFQFKTFAHAIRFVNKTADIAEQEGHHPDILLHNYNKVRIILSTHAIKGLSENDFIEAAKIDKLHIK